MKRTPGPGVRWEVSAEEQPEGVSDAVMMRVLYEERRAILERDPHAEIEVVPYSPPAHWRIVEGPEDRA